MPRDMKLKRQMAPNVFEVVSVKVLSSFRSLSQSTLKVQTVMLHDAAGVSFSLRLQPQAMSQMKTFYRFL